MPGVVSTAAAVEAVTGPARRSKLGLVIGLAVAVAAVAAVAVVLGTRAGHAHDAVAPRAGDPGGPAGAQPVAAPAPASPNGGPRKTGVLRITTDVGVARFFLDGKNVAEGKTATLRDVVAGVHHELRAEAAGEPPQVMQVLVAEGGESVVEVTFHGAGAAKPGAPTPARPAAKAPVAAAPPKAPPAAKAAEAPKPPKPPTKKMGRDDIAEPF